MVNNSIHRGLLLLTLLLMVLPATTWAGVKKNTQPSPKAGEYVSIGGTLYPLPDAWQGEKLAARPLKRPELAAIPGELCYNGSHIYILRQARKALIEMAAGAKADGILLQVDSGYRSSWYQEQIFLRLMKKGRTYEDLIRFVAPPGYSEHMLGTAVDFSPGNWRFARTPAYQWLKDHAADYGFSETYPENNGRHPWEAWHWRYRRSENSGHKTGLRKIPPAPPAGPR